MTLKHSLLAFIVLLSTIVCISCVDETEFDNDPRGNFEALWRMIDEHYCFFDYKRQTYGLDWDAVHKKYAPQFNNSMSEDQLFEVLGNMLAELRDGHVNMYSRFNLARNWSWHENYPSNFSDTLYNKYIGTDYRQTNGLQYRILDDNIGYLRCASFQNGLGAGNLDEILSYFAPCNGLIIDIRNNGGGLITSAETLAARFTNKELLVGYMQHKTGKGHDDFSSMREQRLRPARGIRWQKRVVVLTNRRVYSAANEFVKYMRCCPKATIVGDKTGGGAGLPFSSELPNGWSIRFSACPMYDKDRNSTEFGIEPDYKVGLTMTDITQGRDAIIEYARNLLMQ
ncbi:S41 family peptidase [Hoylesella enoeca]|uniref:Peptidase S41 n=1 Tax=Hoylesella enoeca TaxID=76123 RepID=A0A0S2KIH6_9BACT|nr:S41 family peptidase [Hoylesella enoeca]ALO48109.1 peptidase S41 [Hoylesella enoeca]